MTKQDIINAALRAPHGGYVNTDGKWCTCSDPSSLAEHIASLGFTVTKAYETAYSSAIVETQEGYKMAYNGACSKMEE